MRPVPATALNDGQTIPSLGMGTGRLQDGPAGRVVGIALKAGYRHFDTASAYGNEAGIGRAIAASGLARHLLHITTKVCNEAHGYDITLRALDASLERLRLAYVDLYLIHWPMPARERFIATWRALVRLRDEGKARSIGVSNFRIDDLDRIIDATSVVPAVNQIELHPWLQQHAMREYHAKHGIVTQAWSPLARAGTLLDQPAVQAIAQRHAKSAAQVVLRWHVQSGLAIIPGSSSPGHIAENIDIFDFTLDAEAMTAIAALDREQRIGRDPATFSFVTSGDRNAPACKRPEPPLQRIHHQAVAGSAGPCITGKDTSILVRTYGDESLASIVAALERQTARPRILDLIVVNGKADWRPVQALSDALRTFGGRIIDIAPERFSYGRALNLGLAAARGERVALLSGHSVPADDAWLERLVACLDDSRVAGTCGGQLAYADSDVLERSYRMLWYRLSLLARPLGVFNLSNAAIRRSVWQSLPFDEHVAAFEDRLWAFLAKRRGHVIRQSLHALVWHSHHASVRSTAIYLLRLSVEYSRYFARTRLGLQSGASHRRQKKVRHLP